MPGTAVHADLAAATGELRVILDQAAAGIVAAALARSGPALPTGRPAPAARPAASPGGALFPQPGEHGEDSAAIQAALRRIAELTSVLPAWPPRWERPLSRLQPGDVLLHPAQAFQPVIVLAPPRIDGDHADIEVRTSLGRSSIRHFTGPAGSRQLVRVVPGGRPLTGPIPGPGRPGETATPAAQNLAGPAAAASGTVPVPGPALTPGPGGPPGDPAPARPPELPGTEPPSDGQLAREAAQVHAWNAGAYARAGLRYPPVPGPVTEDPLSDRTSEPAAGTGGHRHR